MDIVYERCAGLDVHKKTVVACTITPDEKGKRQKDCQTFGTMLPDLLKLLERLQELGVTIVAMESTGSFWKPIFNVLEGHMEVILVNAQHLKTVPGRKTDVNDAQWIASLLQLGLLRPSFIPPADQREVRELTRYRTSLIEERSRTIMRLQKTDGPIPISSWPPLPQISWANLPARCWLLMTSWRREQLGSCTVGTWKDAGQT